MADDLQAGICSGSWWNAARSDGLAMSAAAKSVSCSASITDVSGSSGGAFSWVGTEMVESKSRSCDEPAGSASGSSITFQDTHKGQSPGHMIGGQLMDSALQNPTFGLSASTMDWTQALLRSSGRAETSFHAMLQDDLSSRPFFRQDPSMDSDQVHSGASSGNPFKDMNQSFLLDQHHLSSGSNPGDCNINSFQLAPASYGCSTTALHGLYEPDTKPQQSIYDNQSVNYQSPMTGYRGTPSELQPPSWAKFPQLPPKQQSSNQLQFSNNTRFWNASTVTASEMRSGFYPPIPVQFATQTFDHKPSCSNLNAKSNSEGARESTSSITKKSNSSTDPPFKKPRIETPSPLPTFKVRKEKLGDRITALQQLVSPFGKTDTASVLHEAIDYIKFLHDQVSVLSNPYLKHGHPMHQQQNSDKSKEGDGPKQDLRSRGLCLVPIASTYPVASDTPTDFWAPTFGGSYR